MRTPTRTRGVTLTEVLVSAAILATLALGSIVVTDTVTRAAATTQSVRALTRDAKNALNSIKDDLRAASRQGSVTDTHEQPTTLRSDPDKPGSITLHLQPEPTPRDAITYYIHDGTLYRAHRTTLTPLALSAQAINATVHDDLVTITLTVAHADQRREHAISARFRNE